MILSQVHAEISLALSQQIFYPVPKSIHALHVSTYNRDVISARYLGENVNPEASVSPDFVENSLDLGLWSSQLSLLVESASPFCRKQA